MDVYADYFRIVNEMQRSEPMAVDAWGKRISGEEPEVEGSAKAAEKVKREPEDLLRGEDGEAVKAQNGLGPVPRMHAIDSATFPWGVNAATQQMQKRAVVRQFDTGANRDADTDKFDYEAFISPLVEERYAAYMHQNRSLKDGTIRDGDNWAKGIPISVYRKSLERHVKQVKKVCRGWVPSDTLQVDLCAVIFNASGMLHELLKRELLAHTANCPSNLGPFGPYGEVK